jgi:uncharacterized repeat protein (TIGR01451 family)
MSIGANTKRWITLLLAAVLGASLLPVGLAGRSVSAQSEPPLTIELAFQPVPYYVGQQITFSIEETNNSDATFPEVAVRVWLPEDGTKFISATPSQGECFYSSSTHNVFCELADLPAEESASVDIDVITTATGTFTTTAWDILNNKEDLEYTLNPYVPGQDPVIDAIVRNSKQGR